VQTARVETTRRDRLRYRVDEFFARGTVSLIVALFLGSAALVFVFAVLAWLAGLGGDLPFLRVLWMSILRTLDPGTMGNDEGSIPFLGAMLGITLGGIFVISALIGIINNGIQGRLAELRKGRLRVIESGHTVVLGWNQQVFTILSELIGANANQGGGIIVVLADRDKVEMDDEIRTRIGDTRGTKIVCRSGSPVDLDEIDIANQLCAALAPLQHDLAAVEGLQLGTVSDADNGGLRQFLDHHLHHLVLALLVERRGRLVKHDDVRVVQEQTRESEPLFFTAGQRLVPRLLLVLDLVFQVRQSNLVERLLDLFGSPVVGGTGIRCCPSQRPCRHIRPLRQHEQPAVRMDVDASTSPRP